MLPVTLTALLVLASTPPGPPPAAEGQPSPLLLELKPLPVSVATPPLRPVEAAPVSLQGTRQHSRPAFFVSIGAQSVIDGDVSSPTGDDPEFDDLSASIDVGIYRWEGNLGAALELGYLPSSYEVDVSALASDDVDVTRFLLGVRLVDEQPESNFLYHLRAGLALREDDGDVIDEDGMGWYFGGGIEWRFGGGLSVGPQLLYVDTDSADSNELILGLQASYGF